ncbi:NAD(P)/FAD-dependent oxidoreductase [Intestinibacter bartlettii]|uniref:NAD(P)/FAD-dependent oxidoreductase n=1 Tax=Intestinibacter bartlettii TaxID=261299 RepID=UPI0006C4FA50|nr:NAD(P)/FAD-dependent oxidoreductase [Intestinibacter bartlettii]MCC2706736.1 NAD(P)/FAD-dependent oxidoreductase [Intestinibacter bartlettii]MCC2762185.1 NAD(P)/FAD-dependent oxidoreductase [Intestinibacter bartlettii]MDU6472608.1 NAD(P)/FAD-dependent oxidoreductase [Intestinibacter bartlettii]CUO61185.1 tRNA uridine 5-carboxymethylaminomethyl modification protein GidA [Intestinibacter bartlettii]
MDKRYDIAIIGSGIAGMSAALNAKIRKKDFIFFGSKDMSSKLVKAHKINNYPGFFDRSGSEIKDELQKHMDYMDIKITEDNVLNIYSMGDYFIIMSKQGLYEATSVIIATGVNFGKSLKGEKEFLGRGVGYCATCDAALYKDKIVTIISYSKEENEANFLASIASKVYYIPMYKEYVDVDKSIEIVNDIPVEIKGNDFVNELILKKSKIKTDGIFILRESSDPEQLVPGLEIENNHIKVNRLMETNIRGCFAAGDIVGAPYQYVKAAGEGNIAALSAVSYIDNLRRSKSIK